MMYPGSDASYASRLKCIILFPHVCDDLSIRTDVDAYAYTENYGELVRSASIENSISWRVVSTTNA